MSESLPVFTVFGARIRRLPVDRPWAWIAAGWSDLAALPRYSLGFGAAFVAASAAMSFGIWLSGFSHLLLPAAAGFFFLAPLLAIFTYEISRRRESGEAIDLAGVLFALRRNASQIFLMGLALMFLHLVWIRIAMLLFALSFGNVNPPLDQVIAISLTSPVVLPFLVAGTIIGGVLATFAFAISAVSIPMLLDRDVGVATAIATSWVAVRTNWQTMALWAGLIVLFTSLGIATFYVGLILAMPLIGHASWHAYKDIVE